MTIDDVARRAGVSTATVSRVINEVGATAFVITQAGAVRRRRCHG
jgi:DNA-binding LacI/PurR family transcriptional regulator